MALWYDNVRYHTKTRKVVGYLAYEKKRALNNTDRRVKRTKKALRDALLILLEKKPINEISVTELTNLADVNRATFYFYYTDLLDMLQQIQNESYQAFKDIIDESTSSISTLEGFTDYAERLLTFCKDQESLVKFIIKNDTNNQLYRQIQILMLHNIPNSKDTFDTNNPARYSTNYILNAMVGTVIDWMDEGMKISPRELAEYFAHVYLNGLYQTKQFYSRT